MRRFQRDEGDRGAQPGGEHMRFGLGACEVWDVVPAFQVELASRQVDMILRFSGEVCLGIIDDS